MSVDSEVQFGESLSESSSEDSSESSEASFCSASEDFQSYDDSAEPIDHFKVTAAMLPGVQIFWGERAARHKLQMVD